MVRAYGGGGARMRIWGRGVCSDVARRVAIRRCVVIKTGVSVGGMVYVYCDGRGNLRVAKTPPLQSALRGDRWGDYHPRPHLRPADINGNGMEADNDAARRVATSSEKWENRF